MRPVGKREAPETLSDVRLAQCRSSTPRRAPKVEAVTQGLGSVSAGSEAGWPQRGPSQNFLAYIKSRIGRSLNGLCIGAPRSSRV